MVRLQAHNVGRKWHDNGYETTYRLYTESGFKTLYEIDVYSDGYFCLDWDDRFLVAKTPYEERHFETLSDAIVYAENHFDSLRKADKVFKVNLKYDFPLTIDEQEAKEFARPYWQVENPWRNIN